MKNLKYFYTVVFIAVSSFLLLTAWTYEVSGDKKNNKDLIKFSHQFHVEMAGCEDCHTAVPESVTLTDHLVPGKDDCAMCHDVEDECDLCHYEDVFEPLVSSSNDLIFNHSYHLENEDIECVDCHTGFDGVDYSSELTSISTPMEACYEECHNTYSTGQTACESCHISTANLIPQDHVAHPNFMRYHKVLAEQDEESCMMCHDNGSCEECHVATVEITEINTPKDFVNPYAASNFVDGVKQQKIQRVHSLDYRFTHGIDLKGKTSECETCHQAETFCVECHESDGGDFAMLGVVPQSHSVTNFVMIGIGSGGGEHAKLAKRDIERCASCHDTYGNDPVCLECHTDHDGIRGTNPKTHEVGFRSDLNGDWHDDQGSICYNCHISASPYSAKGVGFCGYCHN